MSYTCDLTGNLYNSLSTLYRTKPVGKMTCVEVGSFEGRGSILIHNYLCSNDASKLYCIDPFDDVYVKGNEKLAFWDSACNGQYGRFKHNTQHLPKIIECRGLSDTILPTLNDSSIDFAYIDGDHSPEQVYIDAVNVFNKMNKNGIILFDDYLWEVNGVVTRLGIDKFLHEYSTKYELLIKNFQLAIRIL